MPLYQSHTLLSYWWSNSWNKFVSVIFYSTSITSITYCWFCGMHQMNQMVNISLTAHSQLITNFGLMKVGCICKIAIVLSLCLTKVCGSSIAKRGHACLMSLEESIFSMDIAQFEIAFSASTVCLCVASMCKYVCQDWLFKYKIQYKIQFCWPWQFERHCRFAKVNHDLTTQLSIIVTGLLTHILHAMYRNISNMANQSQPVNLRMHYVILTVTSSGCLKLDLNPWEFRPSSQ